MIKAIIVDDELSAGEVLQTLISSFSHQVTICSICTNIPDAIGAIQKHEPNVIFLDIELADGSGFEVLENLNDLQTRVVFVTAYEHYAINAIKHNAFDYILKPIDPDELYGMLGKLIEEEEKVAPYPDASTLLQQLLGGIGKKIAVPNRTGLEYYFIDDIILIEGQGSYVQMHLVNGSSPLISKKIKDFEGILANKGFLRVHKSFFINLAHIESLHKDEGGYIQMSNGKQVTISPKDKDDILRNIKRLSNII